MNLLSSLCTFISLLVSIYCNPLLEPRVLELQDGERYHFSFDYCPVTIWDNSTTNASLLLNYTAHCFCQYSPAYQNSMNCSVPGPTFQFRTGTTVHMTWYNRVQGSSISDESQLNEYRDLSIFNVHTHGFHIDFDQDNVRIAIPPQTSYTYTYTIPDDHYPGLHIIHSHHHGATSFHKTAGLFSTAIIEYPDSIARDIYDANLLNMKQTILVLSMMYGVDAFVCDCSDEAVWTSFIEAISNRAEVYSYCWEYCSFPEAQRLASDYVYDMHSDIGDEFKLWLINGQHQPTITDMVVNRWRRIRLANVMSQHYMQIALPSQCEWFLLAHDGIFLYENRPRDLNAAPYNGQFILSMAGRADIAVRCADEGLFEIRSVRSNVDTEFENLPRIDDDVLLFIIQINAEDSDFASIDGNDITTLPIEFPPKPRYLDDLSTSNDIGECLCTSFDPAQFEDDNPCTILMRQTQGGSNHVINGLLFNPDVPLQTLQFNQIYEFNLNLGSHVYHQHIYPFQLQQDIGTGILGQANDYMDTIGANSPFLIRTALYDFAGPMVLHCHNLPHEDLGMMGYYDVVNELNLTSCREASPDRITPRPSFQPTIYFTTSKPTEAPTFEPTNDPTQIPTTEPTIGPTPNPTLEPTQQPTSPTSDPTENPTLSPTNNPTLIPTDDPTFIPTKNPTFTLNPTAIPTFDPTEMPTDVIRTTVFMTTDIPKDGFVSNMANEYVNVFGIDDENALVVDLVILGITLAIIVGCVVLFCFCKKKIKERQIVKEASPVSDQENEMNVI